MQTSETIAELAKAMSAAQAAMKPAIKDAVNPAFRSKYADLAAVWEACRQPLTTHGLTVWQDVTLAEKGVSVTTRIVHSSGQWVEFGPLTVPLGKADAHGVGSATSYAKRYALSAALGIVAEEDDDANGATKPAARTEAVTAPKGYDEWLIEMQAVADEGKERLNQAWKQSSAAFREHLTKHDVARYDALRARAKHADARAVPA